MSDPESKGCGGLWRIIKPVKKYIYGAMGLAALGSMATVATLLMLSVVVAVLLKGGDGLLFCNVSWTITTALTGVGISGVLAFCLTMAGCGIHEKTKNVQANSALESDIIEYIQGLAVLRATNQTGKNAKRLYNGIINVRDLQRSSIWGTMVNMVMADMLILFALIMVAISGSYWVGNGTMSIAAIASLLVIVSRLMEPLSLFLAVTSAVDLMSAGFARVKAVMNIPPLEVVSPQGKAQSFEIVFNNVDFTYHGQEEMALKNWKLEICLRPATYLKKHLKIK